MPGGGRVLAADAADHLERRIATLGARAAGTILDGMAPAAGLHIHDQPLRSVRTAAGVEVLAQSRLRTTKVRDSGSVPAGAPSALPGFSRGLLERAAYDHRTSFLLRDVHRVHPAGHPV